MIRTALRHKSNKPLKRLKDTLWAWFSRYRRLLFSDKDGFVRCVTCGDRKFWKEMQAGHYIDGRTNAVLFVEELVHPQCYVCNCMKHGNKSEYAAFMYKKYGEENVNEMRIKSKMAVKHDKFFYETNIALYKEKTMELLSEKGLEL